MVVAHMSLDENTLVASIIIPVYNKEKFLTRCFDSLRAQTMAAENFEVVLVDDGSSDASLELCQSFAKTLPHVKVIAKENGGVSAARNDAIAQAEGKYLFFVDPDDGLSPDTLKNVAAFFDQHYDEVDLVTYPIISVTKNGKERPLHYRYDIMDVSDVYDLETGDNVFICQTTINICVKNTNPKHVFNFVSHNGVEFHEDQQFITDVLLKKMKIGFCKEAAYYWYDNDESVSAQCKTAYYLYDNTMFMYEQLFSHFANEVPQYVQSLLVNDIGWKLRQNALLPTYLHGEAYEAALDRLKALLKRIDDEVLLNHPNVHEYHRYYFLNLKDEGVLTVQVDNGGVSLCREDKVLFESDSVELQVMRVRIAHDHLKLVAAVKSPVFLHYAGEFSLLMRVVTAEGTQMKPLPLTESSRSRIATKDIVARFFDVRLDIDLSQTVGTVEFVGLFNDIVVPILLSFGMNAEMDEAIDGIWMKDGWKVHFAPVDPHIGISRVTKNEERKIRRRINARIESKSAQVSRVAVDTIKRMRRKNSRPIWIYTDSARTLDNGWKQYLHDREKNDGVQRFYAANGISLSDPRVKGVPGVIPFRGKQHKILFCLADKLICSDIDRGSYYAFGVQLATSFVDYFNAEITYLQHGVLWAHMPWYYSYDRVLCDYEVVSTSFESQNLQEHYGFTEEDLIPCGMTRYDGIDAEKPAKKKILLAPSWRSYLVGKLEKNGRQSIDKRFVASDYYQGIQNMLSNPELLELLETYDYELELKLHPQFKMYEPLFHFDSERVKLAPSQVDETDYTLVITDYSSYSFDFVYLKRGIIYFIPDPEQVFNGSNHYSELDIPLEDAFGEYVTSSHEAVAAIKRVIENEGKPLPAYSKKMDNFFFYYDNHQADRLYEFLSQEK